MNEWWCKNITWLKWVLGLIWTAFVFGVGNYISFRETQSKFSLLNEKVNLLYKVVEKTDNNVTKVVDYLLYKEN